MAVKSLFLGIIAAQAVFAFKAGLGLATLILSRKYKGDNPARSFPGTQPRKPLSPYQTAKNHLSTKIFTFALAYALLFLFAWSMKLQFISQFSILQAVIHSGLCLHVILAGLMFSWGLILLKSETDTEHARPDKAGTGWLVLIMPCPVCLLVITLSIQLLKQLSPHPAAIVAGSYLSFITLALGSTWLALKWQKHTGVNREHFLGLAMMGLASYFLLAMLVMPQLQDIDKILRLNTAVLQSAPLGPKTIITWSILILCFSGGFAPAWKKIHRKQTTRAVHGWQNQPKQG